MAQTTSPAAAVCIPLYDKARFVAETVRSVLDQTFTDFELVVLDNASTDGSAEVVRATAAGDPRVVLHRNAATVPPTDNFNRVVALSRAPLVKVLCADDLITPDCLERQVATMAGDPGLAMVTCRQDMVDEAGRVLARDRCLRTPDLVGRQVRTTVLRRLVRHGGNPVGNPGNVLFRRSAFDAARGFSTERHFFTADVGLWVDLLDHGDYVGLPETLTSFRVSAGSDSRHLGGRIADIQRAFVGDLCRRNADVVRRRDRVVSASRAPLTRLRHHMILAASGDGGSPRTRAARRLVGVGRTATGPR